MSCHRQQGTAFADNLRVAAIALNHDARVFSGLLFDRIYRVLMFLAKRLHAVLEPGVPPPVIRPVRFKRDQSANTDQNGENPAAPEMPFTGMGAPARKRIVISISPIPPHAINA